MTNLPSLADRDIRQRQLVPAQRLAGVHAVVIGVGAIGRQLAIQLAALGVRRLTLFDHDIVNIENLAPQGYCPSDLGVAKVHATAATCRQIQPDIELIANHQRYQRSTVRSFSGQQPVVFAAVDCIEVRRLVWESVKHVAPLLIDGRMAAEVIRVLAVDRSTHANYYPTTLFDSSDAYLGSCTARSTIYAASIAAGLMVAQFARWLRGQAVVVDQTLNLLAAELTLVDLPMNVD